MHDPHHGASERENAPQTSEREHALIDPSEADHVGLADKSVAVERQTVRCRIDLEKRVAAQTVGEKDLEAFGEKSAADTRRRRGDMHVRRVCQFFGHKHRRLHA